LKIESKEITWVEPDAGGQELESRIKKFAEKILVVRQRNCYWKGAAKERCERAFLTWQVESEDKADPALRLG
jgi:hypothetical protein